MKKSPPGRQPRNNCRLAFIKLSPRVRRPPRLTHRLLGSWNMQHIRCLLQFSTTKMMQHMHPRCGLVRDKLAEGEDNKAANGHYWDLGQPLPPAPLVRDAVAAENLRGQRREEYEQRRAVEEGQLVNYNQAANRRDRAAAREAQDPGREDIMQDPGPVNLDAMIAAVDLSSEKWKVQAGPVNLKAMIASISFPGDKWDVLDVPPWVHFADEHEAKVAADIFTVGPWRYF
jgi:hypothetical protein